MGAALGVSSSGSVRARVPPPRGVESAAAAGVSCAARLRRADVRLLELHSQIDSSSWGDAGPAERRQGAAAEAEAMPAAAAVARAAAAGPSEPHAGFGLTYGHDMLAAAGVGFRAGRASPHGGQQPQLHAKPPHTPLGGVAALLASSSTPSHAPAIFSTLAASAVSCLRLPGRPSITACRVQHVPNTASPLQFITPHGPLLPPQRPQHRGLPTLVLDLDETMVHSSFTPLPMADFKLSIVIDDAPLAVDVIVRPWLRHFLQAAAAHYEIVVFTASLSRYADAVLDEVERAAPGTMAARLYRESCTFHQGIYVKDLAHLGRPLHKTVIVDNAAASYLLQPRNGLPSSTFIEDRGDTGLLRILDVLLQIVQAADLRDAIVPACRNVGYDYMRMTAS